MTGTADGPESNIFLILVKFTVDVNELRPDPVTREPDLDRAPLRINDFDEAAIEEGVRLKEAYGGRVLALSLAAGDPPRDLVLRVLAMGADAFYLVTDDRAKAGDSLTTTSILVSSIRELCSAEGGLDQPRLIICGDTSVDGLNSQTGPRIAEALGSPSITQASRLEIENGLLSADRDCGDRVERVETALPAVVTIAMEANTPRLPTVLQIMSAGNKPVVNLSAACTGEAAAIEDLSAIRTRSILAPPGCRKRILVPGDSSGELASNLLKLLGQTGDLIT